MSFKELGLCVNYIKIKFWYYIMLWEDKHVQS